MTETPSSRALSTADRALLRALHAWGGEFDRYACRFSGGWQARIRAHWPLESGGEPQAALDSLRADHEASVRPDPARVHPSWFVRALRVEAPSVRLAVAAHAPPSIREALRLALGIEPDAMRTDRPSDPEALGCALALWSERIVGDVPTRDDDPPVVLALTRLSPRDLARLVKVCGLVKHAFAIERGESLESVARFATFDRVRLGYFRRHIGAADPRLVPQARVDLEAIEGDRRRAHSRVGLITFGRSLAAVEPHRARWALQHVPYPIAKRMRVKEPALISRKSALAWESWVLEAAWSRLQVEGRLGRVPL